MSIASIQETLLLYTAQKADITADLSNIMLNLTTASRNNVDLMEKVNEKRAYYTQMAQENPDYADSTQYEIDTQAVQDDYLLQLAEINAWECELEQQQNEKETQIKAISAFEESWISILKNNIKKDFTYGQNG